MSRTRKSCPSHHDPKLKQLNFSNPDISQNVQQFLTELNQIVESNGIQCHLEFVIHSLSHLIGQIPIVPKTAISQRQCDAILDAGIMQMFVKLINCTKNRSIISKCIQLGGAIISNAMRSHRITYDYVCAIC